MKKKRGIFIFVAAFLMGVSTLHAQTDGNSVIPVKQTGEEAKAKSDEEVNKKAAEWVAGLAFTDAAKAQRVMSAIAEHLKAVRDWHNEHPAATVPAGINPATGNKLSELDRQVIASSAIPNTVHAELMTALQTELSPAQLEAVLDNYTIGKVAFTLKGYKAIVPDLTADEEAKILGYLKQAREQAIDYKSMKEISAIFEIYKTKCEQFLNSNGRNWRELFRAYVDKVKKEKA
ncbi:MAG TPA: DUF3826 domain-containing protein, partial [Flavisolibacter sp.]|nr:DUF3826 domain-containing protein [Flavisolibacter sp.]